MGSLFGGGSKKEQRLPEPVPPPAAAAPSSTEDPEKLKRVGRAQLISSSARGVLGNPITGSKKLSV